jgi:hypothetical protein
MFVRVIDDKGGLREESQLEQFLRAGYIPPSRALELGICLAIRPTQGPSKLP